MKVKFTQYKHNKQNGTVLIMVLVFSSLLAMIVLFIWESAILQVKMANNYQAEIIARMKAEASLNILERTLLDDANHANQDDKNNHNNITFLQFVPDSTEFGERSGVDYYRVRSDLRGEFVVQSTVAVRRTQSSEPQTVQRKTWEEVYD